MKYPSLKRILPSILLSAASAFLISCQSQPQPKLEPGSAGSMGKDVVRAQGAGVTVLVEGSEWSGRDAVKAHVTPLKVEVRNGGDVPILIRYQDFTLETEGGMRFAALPLFEIDGSVEEAKPVSYARRPYRTSFYHSGFYTAPYYSSVYPGMAPYPYNYEYSLADYGASYDYWREIDLPTQEMQESALPEGALEPGGEVRGHLFFEKVPVDVGTVGLNFEVVNAETGQTMDSGDLPLRVVE